MSNHARYSSVDIVVEDNRFEAAPFFRTKESQGVPSSDPSDYTTKPTPKQGSITPLLQPTALLLLGALLALGHHFFNSYADGKPLDFMHAVPQVWVNRIGNAFAVAFKAALSTSLGFVLCQLMWFTLRRKFMTFEEIDNVYLTAAGDIMAAFFSSSILKSPLLVIGVAVSFLLAIPTVLTPSSLRVVPHTSVELSSPCKVPTGNVTNGGPGSIMYVTGGWGYWSGITPVAQKLAYSTFASQQIPSLPQPCGLNCTYSVSVPSVAFQCQEGVELPAGMSGTPGMIWDEPFWNATTNGTYSASPPTAFYVYWKSTTASGTNGTALCTVGRANYDFTVQIKNGQQFVDFNVTRTGDLASTQDANVLKLSSLEIEYTRQLSSIASATRSLLLGTISILHGVSTITPKFDSPVISAAFFDSSLNSGTGFTWGNVARGIEQLSHNVSAAILTMDLGLQDSGCDVSRQDIIYEYDRLNLWLPYGIALLVVSLCLALGIMVFFSLNPGNLTPSFSDTVGITRNSSLNAALTWNNSDLTDTERRSHLLRFRLGELKNGGAGFGLREDLKLE